jgi:hypothetical protein
LGNRIYDALGRRVEAIAGGVTTRYYYDCWRALTETNGSDTVQRSYVYGNYLDEALVMVASDMDYYYAHDHLFSPVALMTNDGGFRVRERYEYDAYGKCYFMESDYTAKNAGDYGNPFAYTGQRLDSLDGEIRIGPIGRMGRICQRWKDAGKVDSRKGRGRAQTEESSGIIKGLGLRGED